MTDWMIVVISGLAVCSLLGLVWCSAILRGGRKNGET